jgi:hypothetical protein
VEDLAVILVVVGLGGVAVWLLTRGPGPTGALAPAPDPGLGVVGGVPYVKVLSTLNAPLQKYFIDPVNRGLQDAGIGMPTPKGSLTPLSSANAVLADAICQCYHDYNNTYNGLSACDAANATVPGGNFKKGDADCHPTFPDGGHITLTNAARRAAGQPPQTLAIAWNAPGAIKNAAAKAGLL